MQRSEQLANALNTLFSERGFDVKPDRRLDGHPGVNLVISLRGDGTEIIFTEINFIASTKSFDIIQIYSTLIGDVTESAMTELDKAIRLWNKDFLLGSMGLLDDLHQLYHMHRLAIPSGLRPYEAAVFAFDALQLILRQISLFHPDAVALSAGVKFSELDAED